ncbi:MAG: tetratricopeptide repeat protein [Acidobacteriota bacterium]
MYQESIEILRSVGAKPLEAVAWLNLAGARMALGQVAEARRSFEEAIRMARESDERRCLAAALVAFASLELLARGAPAALPLLVEARPMLEALCDRLELCKLAIAEGHAALASGETAAGRIDLARRLAAEIGIGVDAPVATSIADLVGAQRSFEQGRPLRGGYRPEDVPEALRGVV